LPAQYNPYGQNSYGYGQPGYGQTDYGSTGGISGTQTAYGTVPTGSEVQDGSYSTTDIPDSTLSTDDLPAVDIEYAGGYTESGNGQAG
jgi:hypothetical protein